MEILDHFEKNPASHSNKITWKTYAQQALILSAAISPAFILTALDVTHIFPIVEAPGGWLLMVGTYLATLFFFKKILHKPLVLLLVSLLVWAPTGVLCIFLTASNLKWGREQYLMGATGFWFSYALVEGILFALLYAFLKRRKAKL